MKGRRRFRSTDEVSAIHADARICTAWFPVAQLRKINRTNSSAPRFLKRFRGHSPNQRMPARCTRRLCPGAENEPALVCIFHYSGLGSDRLLRCGSLARLRRGARRRHRPDQARQLTSGLGDVLAQHGAYFSIGTSWQPSHAPRLRYHRLAGFLNRNARGWR
jgi:hypothetical protein